MTQYDHLLIQTSLLDFDHPTIEKLIQKKNFKHLSTFDAIGAAYDFVRNDIKFGYNKSDRISASQILQQGYVQCNTKGILLMTLLRAIGVPCRIRGLTIDKLLQRGVMPDFIFPLVPKNILHSWLEIQFDGRWIILEGFILDEAYLTQLQKHFGQSRSSYCGYGAGTTKLNAPNIQWKGQDTFIQSTGINQDFGIFDTPDELFSRHKQDFPWWKAWLYENIIRHWMNYRVQRIRAGKKPSNLDSDRFTACKPETLNADLV